MSRRVSVVADGFAIPRRRMAACCDVPLATLRDKEQSGRKIGVESLNKRKLGIKVQQFLFRWTKFPVSVKQFPVSCKTGNCRQHAVTATQMDTRTWRRH